MRATPSTHHRRDRLLIAGAFAVVLAVVLAALASAAPAPPPLIEFGETGSAAGQTVIPRGMAVDPANGHVFVVDNGNSRIQEFSPWGGILRAWGWGVVASGPANDPRNEIQQVTVDATGGDFRLQFIALNNSISVTALIPFDASAAAVQAAFEAIGPPVFSNPGFEPGDVAVSGPAGGPWAIEFTGVHADADHHTLRVASSTLSGGAASATVTTLQKGANFEVCVPADGDVCRQGQPGPAPGQVEGQGVAIDSAGDVYVFDRSNRRLQKFDVSGAGVQFEWVAGGGVNQGPTNPGNLCTAAHVTGGDGCGAGSAGSAPGEFGDAALGSYVAVDTRGTAGTGDDRVYAGDVGRIQRFDGGGGYVSEIAVPGETVQSLAVDGAGDLYVALRESSFTSKDDVRKLSAAGASLGTIPVGNPQALATDAAGNLYVVSEPSGEPLRVRAFDPAGEPIASFSDGFSDSTGIASSSACGLESASVYVGNAHFQNSFIRLYGPPFDVDVCPPPSVAPDIADQHAVEVGTGSATLRARINPRFWADTSYRVELGKVDCAVGPCQELPATELGAGIVSAFRLTAPVALGGLDPGTVYHYRFVAESSGGGPAFGPGRTFRTFPAALAEKTDCPNQAFRTGASARLPDCRAFEQVSPVDKGGTPIDSRLGGSLEQAAGDGEALTYSASRAFADPASAPNVSQYLARRDPARGWSSSSISPPRQGAPFPLFDLADLFPHYKAFSADLCSGWVLHPTEPKLTADALEGFPNLYRRRSCGAAAGTYEAATTVAPTEIDAAESGGAFRPVVQGFSADGSRAVFRAIGRLQPNLAACSQASQATSNCVRRLYLAEQGQLTLVSRLPNGNPNTTQSSVGSPDGIETQHKFGSISRAVSADGTRVFWTGSDTLGPGKLYLRLNATEPQSAVAGGECTEPAMACTLEISAATDSRFWTAAADGSSALYTTGSIETAAADLYRFDVSTKQSTLIAGGAIGVAGASDDMSRFYFASRQALAAGASAGEPNLYLHEGGQHRFVAQLSESDASAVAGAAFDDFSPVSVTAAKRTSRVSPDGRRIAFTTSAALADYDNVDTASGQRAGEVYTYDAVTDELDCGSCNPSGARPLTEVTDSLDPVWTAARVAPWSYNLHPGRWLSDDGSRLFFDSFDALLPRDTNGRKDVYEWSRAGGEQDCRDRGAELYVESAGGCLSLISTGTSGQDSSFVDASADGGDVFIATASGLVAHDRDGLVDIYDARAGGGFAAPADPPQPCEGDACQPAPTAFPAAPVAATLTFAGPASPDPGPRGGPARVRVTKPKPVRGFAARLRVKLPAAGAVTVSGRSIRQATRKRTAAGTVRVPVRLTAKTKRALKRKRSLKAKVRVVFKPTTGPLSRATVSLTFKRPASRQGARGRAGEGGAS